MKVLLGTATAFLTGDVPRQQIGHEMLSKSTLDTLIKKRDAKKAKLNKLSSEGVARLILRPGYDLPSDFVVKDKLMGTDLPKATFMTEKERNKELINFWVDKKGFKREDIEKKVKF